MWFKYRKKWAKFGNLNPRPIGTNGANGAKLNEVIWKFGNEVI
jgi:hypothetical protein